MKVFIIDDHILFREGLASLLNNQAGFEVIGESNATGIVPQEIIDLQPDLVLIDPTSANSSGLVVVNEISSNCPDSTIVIITDKDSEELLLNSFQAGAHGFLQKNIPISKLLISLQAVQRGEAAISRLNATRILNEFRRISQQPPAPSKDIQQLTKREVQILTLIGTGASNQEIADECVISINTVKVHVHNILDKLNFRNRHEAAEFAQHARLVQSANNISNPDHNNHNTPK